MNLPDNPLEMIKQAKLVQENLQNQMASIRVETSTGGGMVTVTMDGNRTVTGLVIEPEAAEDIEMLQDMVRGAVNECAKRVEQRAREKLGQVVGSLGLPPGLAG